MDIFFRRLASFVCLGFLLAACTTTNVKTAEEADFSWSSNANKRIVLIEPDVTLGSLTAAGLFEPRADWTQQAKQLIDQETALLLSEKGIDFAKADNLASPRSVQVAKLHSAVGRSILLHLYGAGGQLPNKGKALDWSLGPGSNAIRDEFDSDYGLFLFVQDSYTSAGRAFMMVGAAVLGVGIQGGTQVAFTSLVDLKTGQIVWFNRLVSTAGDLRTEDPAKKVVRNLYEDLPL